MTTLAIRVSIAVLIAAGLSAGDVEKANEYLLRALQTSDANDRISLLQRSLQEVNSFAAHYQLGQAFRSVGRLHSAMDEFRAALELTTYSQIIDRAHVYYQLAGTLALLGNRLEALPYLERSVQLDPNAVTESALLKLQRDLAQTPVASDEVARALSASRGLQFIAEPEASSNVSIWVQFEFGSSHLTDEGVIQTRELGTAIQRPEFKNFRFKLIGHTDTIGDAAYNLELSRQRAQAVETYLSQDMKIPANLLQIEGRGEQSPIIPRGSSEEQAVNRRVEVELLPPLVSR